jgi:hypothetical protein
MSMASHFSAVMPSSNSGKGSLGGAVVGKGGASGGKYDEGGGGGGGRLAHISTVELMNWYSLPSDPSPEVLRLSLDLFEGCHFRRVMVECELLFAFECSGCGEEDLASQ